MVTLRIYKFIQMHNHIFQNLFILLLIFSLLQIYWNALQKMYSTTSNNKVFPNSLPLPLPLPTHHSISSKHFQ